MELLVRIVLGSKSAGHRKTTGGGNLILGECMTSLLCGGSIVDIAAWGIFFFKTYSNAGSQGSAIVKFELVLQTGVIDS